MKQLLVALFAQGVVQTVPGALICTPCGWFFIFCGFYGILAGSDGGSTTDPVQKAIGISRRTCLVTAGGLLAIGMLVLSSALAVYVGAIGLSDDVPAAVEQQARRLFRMTTCVAATDALAIAAGISVAVAQFEWAGASALVPWFGGQLYIAVKILQHLLSDDSLGIGSGVKWDSVFSAVLLIASLAQLIVTLPTVTTVSDDIYQASDGRNGAIPAAYVVGYGTLIFGSSAPLCAFGAGILFLTSNAQQPDFPFPLFAAIMVANGMMLVLWGPAAATYSANMLKSRANREVHGHLKVFEAAFGQPVLLMFAVAMSTAAAVCLRYGVQ